MAQTPASSSQGSSGITGMLSACGFQVWLVDQAGSVIPHLNAMTGSKQSTGKRDVVRAQLKHLAHAETVWQ